MSTTLIIILVGAGLIVIVGGILIFTGKGEWLKKIILPLLAIVGVGVAAEKVFGKSTDAIRKENEEIKAKLKDLQKQHEALQSEYKQAKTDHEAKVADLQAKIDESDKKAKKIQDGIDEMKAGGVDQFIDSKSEEEKQKIIEDNRPPDVEDQFLNPPDGN